MATDGPTPPPCGDEIYKNGETIVFVSAPSNATERWVKSVADEADVRLDWHYFGGVAVVLFLGNARARRKVQAAIDKLESTLQGHVRDKISPEGDPWGTLHPEARRVAS